MSFAIIVMTIQTVFAFWCIYDITQAENQIDAQLEDASTVPLIDEINETTEEAETV